jgi:hypothetical protein
MEPPDPFSSVQEPPPMASREKEVAHNFNDLQVTLSELMDKPGDVASIKSAFQAMPD